jgi:hypothetical protein
MPQAFTTGHSEFLTEFCPNRVLSVTLGKAESKRPVRVTRYETSQRDYDTSIQKRRTFDFGSLLSQISEFARQRCPDLVRAGVCDDVVQDAMLALFILSSTDSADEARLLQRGRDLVLSGSKRYRRHQRRTTSADAHDADFADERTTPLLDQLDRQEQQQRLRQLIQQSGEPADLLLWQLRFEDGHTFEEIAATFERREATHRFSKTWTVYRRYQNLLDRVVKQFHN